MADADTTGAKTGGRTLELLKQAGDVAAPMTNPPTPDTSFTVHGIDPPRHVVWAKQQSSWTWTLTSGEVGSTRLVTRIKQQYPAGPAAVLTVLLFEFGDFAMMRRMLLGIKRRAERAASTGPVA
jgi:hypothetical protein